MGVIGIQLMAVLIVNGFTINEGGIDMNCVTCGEPLTLHEETRKVKYCSGVCRSLHYRDKKLRDAVMLALTESKFYNRIKHFKIGTLEELGFIVTIKEKEISTL